MLNSKDLGYKSRHGYIFVFQKVVNIIRLLFVWLAFNIQTSRLSSSHRLIVVPLAHPLNPPSVVGWKLLLMLIFFFSLSSSFCLPIRSRDYPWDIWPVGFTGQLNSVRVRQGLVNFNQVRLKTKSPLFQLVRV